MRPLAIVLLYFLNWADRYPGPFTVPIHEGAGGTNINAGAAEIAPRLLKRTTESGADPSLTAAKNKGNGPYALHLLAHPNAAATKNAQVRIPVNEGVRCLDREAFIGIKEGYLLDTDIFRHLL